MSFSPLQLLAGISTAWVVKTLLQKYLAVKSTEPQLRTCPGGSLLWMDPFKTLALVSGPYFPFEGQMGYYYATFAFFRKYGSTCLSSVTFWDATPTFWLSDADAIKAVHVGRTTFPKDVEAYETINIYGPNMVGTEGAEWKRHRPTMPTYGARQFELSRNGSQLDKAKPIASGETSVDLLTDLTQVALLVIASAGFGRVVPFKEDLDADPPPGHKLAFKPAVTATLHNLIIKAIIPKWLWNLSGRIHVPLFTRVRTECRESFAALGFHMHEVIASARDLIATGKTATMDSALLRNLVQANMVNDGTDTSKHLTDDDLLSNTFTFLLAGHETSAHSLCFAIILLALYPDVQQRVYEESLLLWPDSLPSSSSPPPYKESMVNLEYTLAVFYETLRLFPPVSRLAKNVNNDTTLTARRFEASIDGKIKNVEKYDVTVKTGSVIVIDIRALHFNPIHWGEDVEDFKPTRFIDTETYRWPRDAFNAFSGGPRSCIGQRFSLTESACILAHVARKFEVHIPAELKDKPWVEQKKILLDWTPGITIRPTNARVTFRRRSS